MKTFGWEFLILFPLPGNPLQARFSGPYVVKSREGDLNYIVKTPDRRKKTQLMSHKHAQEVC